jgi:hypothetical protein
MDSLATPVGNGVHVFDEMRPHVASFRVCDCSVSDYRCGVQLWGWLTQVRESSTGREDYIGIPRIDHNPDGKNGNSSPRRRSTPMDRQHPRQPALHGALPIRLWPRWIAVAS